LSGVCVCVCEVWACLTRVLCRCVSVGLESGHVRVFVCSFGFVKCGCVVADVVCECRCVCVCSPPCLSHAYLAVPQFYNCVGDCYVLQRVDNRGVKIRHLRVLRLHVQGVVLLVSGGSALDIVQRQFTWRGRRRHRICRRGRPMVASKCISKGHRAFRSEQLTCVNLIVS
jgi:hypothetical protein